MHCQEPSDAARRSHLHRAHRPAALLSAPSANRPPQGAPTPGPTARFKPFRTDPLNREPTAKTGSTAPFKPFRTDPLNREQTAKPGATVPFKPFRTDPLNREPAAEPGSTVPFKPSRTDPLNREPTAKPGSTVPFKPFRTDPLNREPAAEPGSTAPFKPFRFKPSRTDPLNREPTAEPGSTVPFKPSRIDPLNREPAAKPGSIAPRVAGSNAYSAAATALPARTYDPAPRPGQSGEGGKVRPAPAEAGGAAPTLLPSPDCRVGVTKITSVAPRQHTTLPPRENALRPVTLCPRDRHHAGVDHHR